VTDMEWAKRQGATAYLVKPTKEDELLALVEKTLGA